jgi:hypothetical protein
MIMAFGYLRTNTSVDFVINKKSAEWFLLAVCSQAGQWRVENG